MKRLLGTLLLCGFLAAAFLGTSAAQAAKTVVHPKVHQSKAAQKQANKMKKANAKARKAAQRKAQAKKAA